AKQHAETEAIIGQSRGSGGRTVVLDSDRVVPNFALPFEFFRPKRDAGAQHFKKGKARPFDAGDNQISQTSRVARETARYEIGPGRNGEQYGIEGPDADATRCQRAVPVRLGSR